MNNSEAEPSLADGGHPSYGQLSFFTLFTLHYSRVHGYLGLGVCLFGMITNSCNIVVLTR